MKPAPSHKLRCILRWPSENARSWAEGFLCRLEDDERALCLVAVGSAVRPVDRSADVDFVLVCRGRRQLALRPPPDVEVKVFCAEDVGEEISTGNDLLVSALRYGEIVHEREGYWTALRKAWEGRLPLPPVARAVNRADRSAQRLRMLLLVGDAKEVRFELLTMLTQLARARLLGRAVHPASRPELPDQLRRIGEDALAEALLDALEGRKAPGEILSTLGIDLQSVPWTPG